jgi:1-acyl-sn-glycerol-3-phosphate acyltransferase
VRKRVVAFNVAMATLVCAVALTTGPFVLLFPRTVAIAVADWWCRANLKLLRLVVGIDLEIRGAEHIPAGAALVAAKHHSALETFGLMPSLRDPAFILKRELTWLPFFGWFLLRMKMIAINRKAGTEALAQIIEQAKAAAADGRQIVIYPEGTRRKVGEPPRYKLGVGHLYEKLRLPCHPVAIDAGVFWPKDTIMRRQGRAVIEFLEPIQPGLERQAFLDLLRERIETGTQALVSEALDGSRPSARM